MHRKINHKSIMVDKLQSNTDDSVLSKDLACLTLRPFQWPSSIDPLTTQHANEKYTSAMAKVVEDIQVDRLKLLKKDLVDFKSANTDEILRDRCLQDLVEKCPTIIQHTTHVKQLLLGLEKDITLMELPKSKPPSIPTPAAREDAMDTNHAMADEMRDLRQLVAGLQKTINHLKAPRPSTVPKNLNNSRAQGKPKAKTNAKVTKNFISPDHEDVDDPPFTLVNRGRSRSPKNESRVGKGPYQRESHQNRSRSPRSRTESHSSRNARQNNSLSKAANSHSPSQKRGPTIDREFSRDGKTRKGKGDSRV
jgi:hypothetical protein